MREMICRGLDEKGNWRFGYFWKDNFSASIREVNGSGFTCDHEVVPETVGQFTGLLDRNGKRIFEGDIVRMWNGNKSDIKHVDGYWCVSKKNRQIHWTEWKDFEVTGTIHDKPKEAMGK